MPSPACIGKVEWISTLNRDNPIKVRFDDGFAGFYSVDRVTKIDENKINEEDLFPNASEEEVKKRKEEQRRKREEELSKFKVGDEVRTFLAGIGQTITAKIISKDINNEQYPFRIQFFDGQCINVDADEVEKVKENKINEEDLFPNASKEDIVVRKEEQRRREEALFNSFKIGDKVMIQNAPSYGTGEIINKNMSRRNWRKYSILVRYPLTKYESPGRYGIKDPENPSYGTRWFAPEELEKVS